MATFIHNEPTSLGVLQEMQMPQSLYAQLEREIPPSFDVSNFRHLLLRSGDVHYSKCRRSHLP